MYNVVGFFYQACVLIIPSQFILTETKSSYQVELIRTKFIYKDHFYYDYCISIAQGSFYSRTGSNSILINTQKKQSKLLAQAFGSNRNPLSPIS